MFAAGDCFYEKKISLRHPGLHLAAPFISAVRGVTAEFETKATEGTKNSRIVAFEKIGQKRRQLIWQKSKKSLLLKKSFNMRGQLITNSLEVTKKLTHKMKGGAGEYKKIN